MTVTKVVGLDLRIPKHFSLYFSDFYTILYGFYKFAVFENKRKRKRTLASRPLEVCFFSLEVPGGLAEQRRARRRFSRRGGSSGVGARRGRARGRRRAPIGGLGLGRDGLWRRRRGRGRRRRLCAAAAARRWRRDGVSGLGGFGGGEEGGCGLDLG